MARGWESKSVESQMDSAAAARGAENRASLKSAEEVQRESKVHSLMLSRTRVMHDLQAACNPRYRGQLEQALAFLDQQIAELQGPRRK
jgi:hypothetical protein